MTYKLDLLRQGLESLPPEVQVNPLRVAVHHLRHLGDRDTRSLIPLNNNPLFLFKATQIQKKKKISHTSGLFFDCVT